jgi:hypothetical protein
MRPIGRYALTFGAGIALGAIVAGLVVARHFNSVFWDSHVGSVGDQAFVAREIYAGRSKELADRIRESLPTRVEGIEQACPIGHGKEWAYWLIKDVYDVSGTPVPPTLSPRLSTLPPRPSCKKPTQRVARVAA